MSVDIPNWGMGESDARKDTDAFFDKDLGANIRRRPYGGREPFVQDSLAVKPGGHFGVIEHYTQFMPEDVLVRLRDAYEDSFGASPEDPILDTLRTAELDFHDFKHQEIKRNVALFAPTGAIFFGEGARVLLNGRIPSGHVINPDNPPQKGILRKGFVFAPGDVPNTSGVFDLTRRSTLEDLSEKSGNTDLAHFVSLVKREVTEDDFSERSEAITHELKGQVYRLLAREVTIQLQSPELVRNPDSPTHRKEKDNPLVLLRTGSNGKRGVVFLGHSGHFEAKDIVRLLDMEGASMPDIIADTTNLGKAKALEAMLQLLSTQNLSVLLSQKTLEKEDVLNNYQYAVEQLVDAIGLNTARALGFVPFGYRRDIPAREKRFSKEKVMERALKLTARKGWRQDKEKPNDPRSGRDAPSMRRATSMLKKIDALFNPENTDLPVDDGAITALTLGIEHMERIETAYDFLTKVSWAKPYSKFTPDYEHPERDDMDEIDVLMDLAYKIFNHLNLEKLADYAQDPVPHELGLSSDDVKVTRTMAEFLLKPMEEQFE